MSKTKHFHFIGICGTAMGSTALALRAQGHKITGSDGAVYPPMSTLLESNGIELFSGLLRDRKTLLGWRRSGCLCDPRHLFRFAEAEATHRATALAEMAGVVSGVRHPQVAGLGFEPRTSGL